MDELAAARALVLRVRPNHGFVGLSETAVNGGSATEAASIPEWLSLIDLSTAINSSWIGGSAFLGNMATKSASTGSPSATTGASAPYCNLPLVRWDRFLNRFARPVDAKARDQSFVCIKTTTTCQRDSNTSSQLTSPSAVSPLRLWTSSASMLLYWANRCVSHGCSAHVSFPGITQIQRSRLEATRRTLRFTCARSTSRYRMNRCVFRKASRRCPRWRRYRTMMSEFIQAFGYDQMLTFSGALRRRSASLTSLTWCWPMRST